MKSFGKNEKLSFKLKLVGLTVGVERLKSLVLSILTLLFDSMLLLHVSFAQHAGPEGVVAHGAFERLHVDNHMTAQAPVGRERGIANITAKRLHSWQISQQQFDMRFIQEMNISALIPVCLQMHKRHLCSSLHHG